MTITAAELSKVLKEEHSLDLSLEAAEKLLLEKFGNTTVPGSVILGTLDKTAEEAKKFTDPKNGFLSKMILDMDAIRRGQRPECGTDFDELEKKRDAHYKLTGVAVGAANSAGNFVPAELTSDWINLVFRDDALLSKCRRRPMATDALLIPTLTGGITVYITPESTNTSDMATQDKGLAVESQITTGQITLTRYELTVRALVSRKTLRIAAVAEDALRNDMPQALRALACKAITVGHTDTGGTISGLDTLVTTNAKTWNAAAPRRGMIEAINSPGVALSGAARTSLMVGGPGAVAELACLEDGMKRPLFVEMGQLEPTGISGIPLMKDFNIPSTYGAGTDSRLYGGDFKLHANVGMEDAMFLQVNPYSNAKNGLVEIIMAFVFGWVPSSEKAFWYMNVPTA